MAIHLLWRLRYGNRTGLRKPREQQMSNIQSNQNQAMDQP